MQQPSCAYPSLMTSTGDRERKNIYINIDHSFDLSVYSVLDREFSAFKHPELFEQITINFDINYLYIYNYS